MDFSEGPPSHKMETVKFNFNLYPISSLSKDTSKTSILELSVDGFSPSCTTDPTCWSQECLLLFCNCRVPLLSYWKWTLSSYGLGDSSLSHWLKRTGWTMSIPKVPVNSLVKEHLFHQGQHYSSPSYFQWRNVPFSSGHYGRDTLTNMGSQS